MTIVFIVVGVVVLAIITQIALGKFNDSGADNYQAGASDLPDAAVVNFPADPQEVTARDIDELKFSLSFRGYRIDQVDSVLDQLSATVSLQSAEIARLRLEQSQNSQIEG